MQRESKDRERTGEYPDELVQDVARARGSVLGVVFGTLVWILATGVVACCRAVI